MTGFQGAMRLASVDAAQFKAAMRCLAASGRCCDLKFDTEAKIGNVDHHAGREVAFGEPS
jgi:hypothetical protein